MLRKVAILVVSAGLTMSPLSVQALGFGGIKLKSSLNEKLSAEVALLSANANDVQSLTIKLATEEAFLRTGIERTALLNKLKFKVKQRANGDYYIDVTTSETVREPFMNFLVELNWKNGRMLREYTMLIDPPGSAPIQAPAPAPVMAETIAPEVIAEPIVEVAPGPVVEEPVVAVIDEPSPFVEPVVEAVVEPVPEPISGPAPIADQPDDVPVEEFVKVEPVEPAPVVDIPPPVEMVSAEVEQTKPEVFDPESAFIDKDTGELWPRIPLTAYSESSEEDTSSSSVAESAGEMGDLDYGIIKAGDNLWNIAEKLRQGDESVSVHQVMMTLLQNNPNAFIDNNVHRLKVGHVLRIDDPSAINAMSRKEAANAYVEQTGAWNNYRQQTAEAAGIQPIMAGDDVAADDIASAEAAGELTLAAPEGESLTAGGGANEESLNNDLATVQDQLRQAKSDSGTMRTRNVDLNNKLQSLEDELNRLQRSISVKDDELAALQQQLSSLDQQPVKAPTQEAMPTETPEVIEEKVAAPVPAPIEEPVMAEEPEKTEVTPPAVAEAPKLEKSPVKLAEEIAEREKEASKPEEGIMASVMGVIASIGASVSGIFAGLSLGGDSLLYIIAPLIVVVLIIAVVLIRRRSQGDNFQESILTGAATATDTETNGVADADSATFSEESSFLSDFAMSGASAIEADDSEVDPLTEADVFMAYGRYEAAEERLNEAVQNEPDRMELRAKLLELYHATKNKAAFESSAEDFYASLDGAEAENPLWAKVIDMGAEIAPENPLFSAGSADVGTADLGATGDVPAMGDMGMSMTDSQVMDIGLETGVFAAADLAGSPETSNDDMDFNLDLGDSFTAETTSNESTDAAEPEMDFNLDIGGADEIAKEEPAADLDFNLDMGTDESTDDLVTEDSGLDFNLDIGDEDTTGTEEPVAEEAAADLDFNLDMDTADSTEDAGLDFNLGTDEPDASLDFDTGTTEEDSLDLNLDAADTADDDMDGSDEVGTKLDLAKAYIDMGDPEGARSILDEVMDEGSSTQKEEAQSLLGQIA